MVQQSKYNTHNTCAPVQREKDILQHMIDSPKNMHLVYLDRDFNFVRVNQAYADTCGYNPEEMIGKNHFALYPHKENEAIFKRVRDTGVPAQYHDKPFSFPDQPERGITYWDWTLEPVKDNSGKTVGLIFSLVETTERKRAEEEVARVASFPTLNPNPIFEADFSGNITYFNPAAKSGFGIETLGASSPLLADWKNVVEAIIKSSGSFSREVKAGGRWYLQQLYLVPNTECVRVYSSDITESKKTEEALNESNKNFSALFSNMANGFAYCQIILDQRGKPIDFVYLQVNDAFERLTGLKCESVIGRPVSEAIPGTREANPEIFDIYGRVALTGNSERFEIYFKPLRIWFDISVYSPKKGYFAAVFDNITQRKADDEALKHRTEQLEQTQKKLEEKAAEVEEYAARMEELAEERLKKLKDTERLAAIGSTAGMVGHDIRNPLQAITSDLYLIKGELSSTPECKTKEQISESIEGIEKNVDYINKIVADLQDYARAIAPAAQEVDLSSLCESVLFKNGVPKEIMVKCEIEKNVKVIVSDKDLLKRILSNLASNAVQAMPEGGTLTVHAFKKLDDIIITVEDTGVGIPEEIRNKLFTPMFTTKSKGQGFGLAVVKRMTEALGGSVAFESEVGKGAKFIIRLPPPKEINGKWQYK